MNRPRTTRNRPRVTGERPANKPTPLAAAGRGRRGGGRPPGARPTRLGGPNDGGAIGDRLAGGGRRIGLIVLGVVLLLFLLLAGSGLDLWTDAIWFRSVGYDAVFFTRLWAQLGLFALGAAVGIVVLFGNLWLAGRLSPPPNPDGKSSVAAFLDRLSQARGPAMTVDRSAARSTRAAARDRGPSGAARNVPRASSGGAPAAVQAGPTGPASKSKSCRT